MATLCSAEDRPDDPEAADEAATELALCVLLQTLEVNQPSATVNPEELDAVLTHVLSQRSGPAVAARSWSTL